MLKLRTVTYYPSVTDRQFIQFCLRQFIFSRLKKITPVFNNPSDPYAVDFYSEDEDFEKISSDIELMPEIYKHLNYSLMDFFFIRGRYVANNAPLISHKFNIKPCSTCNDSCDAGKFA